MNTSIKIALLLLPLVLLSVPEVAFAYGGPGSVISGIGAFLAAVAAVLAAIFGFLWYPLKRLYKKMTAREEPAEEAPASQTGE
jgi:hypothetical protein